MVGSWIGLLAGGVLLAGCSAPERTGPVTLRTFEDVGDAQREVLWNAAQDVLREHHFRLDRVDRRAGIIQTYPQTSQHAFEFWRKDVDTAYDFLEASMRTVRRSVEVGLAPAESGDALTVTVRREYYSTPERQFNSSVAALRMFTTDLPRADTGERITAADSYWIDAGRDPDMEAYLLGKIVARAGGA